MSSQQLADILLAQWQLLWPLPPVERMRRIDEVRLDYLFEEQMHGATLAMSEPEGAHV